MRTTIHCQCSLPLESTVLNRFLALLIPLVIALAQSTVVFGQASSKLVFQYEFEDARVSIPTAQEPRVEKFGPDSLRLAAKYLELGAASWANGRGCVNCHTTGPYLADATAWASYFGKPNQQAYESFAQDVPGEINDLQAAEQNGHRYYPGTFSSVWRSLGLAQWDRHVSGKLAEVTDRSLRDMFKHQSESGAFVTHGEVEIPHITTDFELSLQAARAIVAAPGWLETLTDPALMARVEKLKHWLASTSAKNDYDRVLKLQLACYWPECVSQADRDAAMDLLTARQHEDGGWSTRDMSAVQDWHFEMSPKVLSLLENLPDAQRPQSDAYMTALAIVLMRQNDIPASDPRIARGLNWLKHQQRESGRWWMHSLYRGNYHYTTYIATVQALKAFEACGEFDALKIATAP